MTSLFDSLRLRDLTVANRVWVSPMCMYACEGEPGVVGAWHVAHYGQFALGGAGLIVTEATAVLPEGRVTPEDAGLWGDDHVAPWKTVTDAVHLAGSAIAVQLAHAGRKGGKFRGLPGDEFANSSVPADLGGWTTVGATGEAFGRYDAPAKATADDLAATVAAFGAAARRADEAGFDAIELHGAHGYLLHELLSPVTNTRDDDWASRERLLLETVAAVRANWPQGKPLIVRLSVDDVAPGGLTAEDSASLATRLGELGVDLIDCSSGGLVAGAEYAATPGYQVPGAATVRRLSGLPTSAVGLITSPEHAASIVAEGSADAVMLGREMLRNPYWARHAASALGVSLPGVSRYHRAHA
ncbi:2,4-dienoyl-CoA reductase-like NADH-dependent reductase (Old Yellow Enzyme family) [Conyzicola lurida]|uniref:2,4-dienoyl-CoA reductase-like NADH-dependent reductase (Old Yellow Enzyme family) n=1 Tax=Conyzicola lurida TaxID=1172621 RepID=A0A841AT54_9MICO|nr:2,4-dienoyl-CoA reductase-like NADH-dependent reductase (Old Yellow Enzyme family) [Conyzicola lurida]